MTDVDRRGGAPPREEATVGRRTLREEIVIVLALTFLASATFALIDLLSAPIKGVTVRLYPQVGLATQLADIVFGVVPVWLVLYLVRRSGEGVRAIGLDGSMVRRDVGRGLGLGLLVAGVGLGVYEAAVHLGVNRFVVPVPPLGHWWTVPVLVLGAAQIALLEETIVAAYLLHRLDQLGWSRGRALAASALLRGAYHLYQGWGGFLGNLALGLAFGYLYQRTRRAWPLVVAHFTVDVLAGLGYLVFRGKLTGI
jgi:membrane protease YdiL (CAAX protease family)